MFWFALLIFTVVLMVNVFGVMGLRTVKHLRDIEALKNGPLVSVVMAAKDEENAIGESIQKLLDQTYENIEIIIINDRSQDNTAKIIEGFGEKIKAAHIDILPEGWLGKNHACHCGAQKATGKYLLFVDADSHLEPSTIGRAVRHMEDNELDLMSAIYSLKDTGKLTKSIVFDNTIEGLKTGFAWNCRKRESKSAVATGKFNMFRHEVYERSQGYGAIPLSVVDDVAVAAQVKKENARGDFVWGHGYVEVDWYKTPLELLKGTRKHIFAGMNFSLMGVALISAVAFVFYIFPIIGIFITEGYTQALFIGVIIIRLLMFQWENSRVGAGLPNPFYSLLTYPFTIVSIWYSAFHVLSQGGVEWSGNVYTIDELKKTNV